MEEIQLQANKRTIVGKQVNALRREGLIPAIVYGGKEEPIPVELDAKDAIKILNETSTSTLITLKVGKANHRVLLRDIQYDVIRRFPIHVDFLRVEMDTAIRTTVPIDFIGEAPGVGRMIQATSRCVAALFGFAACLPEAWVQGAGRYVNVSLVRRDSYL